MRGRGERGRRGEEKGKSGLQREDDVDEEEGWKEDVDEEGGSGNV